jgi:hypothetical protein
MSSFFILSFLFYKNQRKGGWNRSCPGGRLGTSGRGKGYRRVNMVQKCVHMYINAKMIPVETFP